MNDETLEGNDLFGIPSSMEEAMRISGMRHHTQDSHEKEMYQDAARKVIFKNCMEACDIPKEAISNFNRNFYYNQLSE